MKINDILEMMKNQTRWGIKLTKLYCYIVCLYKYAIMNPTTTYYNAPIKKLIKAKKNQTKISQRLKGFLEDVALIQIVF